MAYRLRFEDLYKMFPDRKEYDKPRLVDLVLFEPSPDGMYARGYIDNQVRCVRSYMPFDRVKDISLDNGMFTFYEGQYNPYKVFNTNTIKLMVGRSYHRLIDDMFNDLCVINDGYTLTETGDIENYNGMVHANIIREVIYECVITNNRKCWIHIKPYICHTYHHSLKYLSKVIALYDTKDNNVLFWTSEYESFTSPNYSLNVNKIPYLHLR